MLTCNQAMIRYSAVAAFVSLVATPAAASFLDDFEDGNVDGWSSGNTGCCGSHGTVFRNGSTMAFVYRHYDSEGWLAQDFAYDSTAVLSFDMQALAISRSNEGKAGVRLTFLSAFNLPVGSVSLLNVPSPASLGPNEHYVDSDQHTYSSTMQEWASFADIANPETVSKVSLRFLAWQTGRWGEHYNTTVWFDNVRIAPIPEPAAGFLMIAGLAGLLSRRVSRQLT